MDLKVLLAQSKSDPAAFASNFQTIQQQIELAVKQKADLLIFPELMLCGYTHLDLVNHQDFLNSNQQYLDKVKEVTPESLTVILGFAEADSQSGKRQIYNSAAVISNQQIQTVIRKQLLPTYDIFDERRYFSSGQPSKIIEVKGVKVGIGICEDLWDKYYQEKVYPDLIEQGAEVLVNISASPYRVGKLQERIDLVEKLVDQQEVTFIYLNLVGGYDGYEGEVVFDGQSFVRAATGDYYPLLALAKEDSVLLDLAKPAKLKLDQIISQETKELHQLIILGIQDYFRRNGLKKAYLGLSGGIDSALCLALLVEALGADKVVAVTMPSHISSNETQSDAKQMAEALNVQFISYSIAELFKSWQAGASEVFNQELASQPNDMALQNTQARLRGLILMSFTNQDPGSVVITTGNKTEIALGYCTIYGDMCGALAPIADLNKDRVYQLSNYINQLKAKEVIPETIIQREPTAELAPGQTDEANLPANYITLAPLVDEIIESKYSYQELVSKYDPEVVDQTLRLIKINEFKRRQAAPGIRLTSKAFGMGRRVPMSFG